MLTLPLYDRNGIYVRQISMKEAAQMVDNDSAAPIIRGGWRDREDVEWEGIRLCVTRYWNWSSTSLNENDMLAIVGAAGSQSTQAMARAKLRVWKEIH